MCFNNVWVDSLAIQRGPFAAVPVFTIAHMSIQITWFKIATEKCSAQVIQMSVF